jgi:hypothetical protein
MLPRNVARNAPYLMYAAVPIKTSCGLPSVTTDSTTQNAITKPKTVKDIATRGILTRNSIKTGERRRVTAIITDAIIRADAKRPLLNENKPGLLPLLLPVRKR